MQVKDLKPNEGNPRTIDDEKLIMLGKALVEFGDLGGIVFNRRSNRLVGGHQRIKIIPKEAQVVIEKKHQQPTNVGTVAEGFIEFNGERYKYREVDWDEPREKAANIAANKGAGEWDLPKLSEWLKELDGLDFDLNLTMFDESEIKKLTGIEVGEHSRVGPTGVDEDEVPEKVPPRSKLGDIYLLGNHRLMCGDSTSIEAVEKLMNGDKADMVFTDPPYGISLNTNYVKSEMMHGNTYKAIAGDNTEFDPGIIFGFFQNVKEIFVWGANNFCDKIDPKGSWIVWDKSTDKADSMISGDFELCYSKQRHKYAMCRIYWKGMSSEKEQRKVHPSQKPVALAEWFFARWGSGLQNIADLFGGSGSTLIACEKTNRTCFMMELDPHYVDVIVSRWEKYTGKKAELCPTEK